MTCSPRVSYIAIHKEENFWCLGKSPETLGRAGGKTLIRKEIAQDSIWMAQQSCCFSFSPTSPKVPKIEASGQWPIRELLIIADNTKLICIASHLLETVSLCLCILYASVTDRNNEKIGVSTEQLWVCATARPWFLSTAFAPWTRDLGAFFSPQELQYFFPNILEVIFSNPKVFTKHPLRGFQYILP